MREHRHGVCVMEVKNTTQIKAFSWYLKERVILTKGNFFKRKWQGNTKCCFYSSNEILQHFVFLKSNGKVFWNVVRITFAIQPPCSVSNLLGSWLKNFSMNLRNQILSYEPTTLCCAIWLSRNDVVFSKNTHLFYAGHFQWTRWLLDKKLVTTI